MTRGVAAVDRLLAAVIGLALVAGGVALWAWHTDRLPVREAVIDAGAVYEVFDRTWWPWALGGGGVVVAILGLVLLTRQLPVRGPSSFLLAGDATGETAGAVSVDSTAVTSRASDVGAAIDGVRSVRARTTVERGHPVVSVAVVAERDADFPAVVDAVAAVRSGITAVLESTSVPVRVTVTVR